MRVNEFQAVLLWLTRDEKRMELYKERLHFKDEVNRTDRLHRKVNLSSGLFSSNFNKPNIFSYTVFMLVSFQYTLFNVSGRMTVLHRSWENLTKIDTRNFVHVCVELQLYAFECV